MKDNKLLKVTSLVMLLTIIALSLVSGAYAKYTSSATGTGSAQVALWDIRAGESGSEVSITGNSATVEFNLFDTILDTGGTAAETDVDTAKIAPGTEGSFDLSILNNSEVTAEYAITFALTNASNVPIEFTTDGGSTWVTSLSNVAATTIAMNDSDTVTIGWRWAFTGAGSSNFTSSQTDATDTALGLSTPTVTVEATLTVNQVD